MGALNLGLNILGITIPSYIWIGILLIILGFMIATFIPVFGVKIGFIMIIAGLILTVGFTLIVELWKTEWFKILSISLGTLALVLVILKKPSR